MFKKTDSLSRWYREASSYPISDPDLRLPSCQPAVARVIINSEQEHSFTRGTKSLHSYLQYIDFTSLQLASYHFLCTATFSLLQLISARNGAQSIQRLFIQSWNYQQALSVIIRANFQDHQRLDSLLPSLAIATVAKKESFYKY